MNREQMVWLAFVVLAGGYLLLSSQPPVQQTPSASPTPLPTIKIEFPPIFAPTPAPPYASVNVRHGILVYFQDKTPILKQMALENVFYLCHEFTETNAVVKADLVFVPFTEQLCNPNGFWANGTVAGCFIAPKTIAVRPDNYAVPNFARMVVNHEIAHYLGLSNALIHSRQDEGVLRGDFGTNQWDYQLFKEYADKYCS